MLKNTSCKNVHLFWEKDFSNIFPRVCSPFHKNSLTIILRQFLSPFHKDYLKTNFNLTTKITLTIKNSSLGVLDTTLCDKVCQWLATGRWFSPGITGSSTNTTNCHDITEILLKGALNTINYLPQQPSFISIAQQNIFFNKIIL